MITQKDRIEAAIRHIQTAADIDPWAEELAVDALKKQADLQPTCNNLATDTISRQAAIDAILAVTGNSSVRELYEHVQEHGLSDMWSGGVNAAIDIIIALPSAQPEPSDVARSIATIIENEQDMRVVLKNAQNDIVHCRDCKFCHKSPDWKHRQSFGESIWYCEENRGFNFAQTVGLDDYCSSAERRADEQTD